MGRWRCFSGSSSACSAPARQNVSYLPRQRDTLSDYCVAATVTSSSPRSLLTERGPGGAGGAEPGDFHEHLVDIAIRNEPSERDRDELERHVDTFSDELELEEPTTLWGRLVRSVRNGGVLHPQSYWHLAWLLLVSACFVFNCITIPLRSTFPYQTEENWLTWFVSDLTCDAIYLLDLVFVKPHLIFVYDGFWVREKRLTRKHYFAKMQFFMDIVSLTPLDILYLKFGKELVLLRLPRLLKIQTFWELFDHLDSLLMSPYLVRVARTLCYMMYLVHLNACGYYAFSAREGLGANNWTYKGGDGNAYIRCFYFATKTATSVGKNPRPETEGEYLFMTCSWLMGVFVFALLIGQIRDIVATASRTRTEHRKRLDETLEHMRGLSLPDKVQKRVQSWFTFADQHQPFDEARILNSLPQKLKTDVAINVHGGTLDKVALFNRIDDPALLRDLVLKLRSVIYLPGDFICRKHEVGKEMYIVKTGKVEVTAEPYDDDGEPSVIATLDEGSVFGEISLLALPHAGGNRRTADVRSKGFSNLFVLSKSDLHETLVYYPEAREILKQKAEALVLENLARERRESRAARGSPEPTATPEVPTILDGDLDGDDGHSGNGAAGALAGSQSGGTRTASRASSLAVDKQGQKASGTTPSQPPVASVKIRVTSEMSPPPPLAGTSILLDPLSFGAEGLARLLDMLPPTTPMSPTPDGDTYKGWDLAHLLDTLPPTSLEAGATFRIEDLVPLSELLPPPTPPTPPSPASPTAADPDKSDLPHTPLSAREDLLDVLPPTSPASPSSASAAFRPEELARRLDQLPTTSATSPPPPSIPAEAAFGPEELSRMLDLLPPTSPMSPPPSAEVHVEVAGVPGVPGVSESAVSPEELRHLLDLLPPSPPASTGASGPGPGLVPGGRRGSVRHPADGHLPAVRVTAALAPGTHESPLTSITSASAARSCSGASRSSRSSRCSRRSRGSCSSCGAVTGTCPCCCSCGASCSGCAAYPSRSDRSTAATSVAVAWGGSPDDAGAAATPAADDPGEGQGVARGDLGVEHEADTLSDLSSSSLLSPLQSPTLEGRRPADLLRRRESAPNPATSPEAPDGCLLVPHRLSYPTSGSRQKQRSLANRRLSHQDRSS